MPEREYDAVERWVVDQFEDDVYERTGEWPSPELVSDFMQLRDEIKEAVESGDVNNIMDVFADITSEDLLDIEFESDAIEAVAKNGTIDDLREMIEPYFPVSFDPILEPEQFLSGALKDEVEMICDTIKEAVENDKFSDYFNIFSLNEDLDIVSDSKFLTGEEKDTLNGIVIMEEVYNPNYGQICQGLDYLASNGDFNGTLDELSVTSDYLQSENLPKGINERIEEFFTTLKTEYIEVNNDTIFDGIKDVVENHPDEIENMLSRGGEGIIDLNYEISHAFPDERFCDERLLDIRDVVREFNYIDGEIETREEAIEKITELLDEYQEENSPADIEAEETVTVGGETFTSSDFSEEEGDMEALSDAFDEGALSDADFDELGRSVDASEDVGANGADISDSDDIHGVDIEDGRGSVDDDGSDPVD